ncbi:FAD/NAD(P)-binding protein [Edaphobacter flagellatus]|uniref:FAD/NAD(P)-binding protein n=1 Tax=Edaphobacter flagellatus TaxID=1933044 RepID=UPI0021B32115|nr:FAD/NAD(P)-binding protein [Edaphobacter flagellatus]
MNTADAAYKTVAIIGGGVSGALTAYHLVQQSREAAVALRIVLIDPSADPGKGLAYSTPSLRHLLNVPAGKISALPADPGHFLRWLRANYDPHATAFTFAPRAVFGRYIRSIYAQAVRAVEHIQLSVTDVSDIADGVELRLSDGSMLKASYVVLATGNFDPPMLPGVEAEALARGVYRNNAWLPDTFDHLDPDASVTLVGTGLTSIDVLQRLRELGHRGVVTAISRHGVFPSRHAEYTPAATYAIPAGTPATCVAYLRALRGAIASGIEWRAAIDSLRSTTNDLWLALPLSEQRRFRRHLQRRWDVVRHRMAASIADFIDAELAAGTLMVREGSFAGVAMIEDHAEVSVRGHDATESFATARVINCTGPSMNYRSVASPLFRNLFAKGIATPGPMGGGFHIDTTGALIDESGRVSTKLYCVGPGRLGTLIESIAVPEIREQACETAALIVGHSAVSLIEPQAALAVAV